MRVRYLVGYRETVGKWVLVGVHVCGAFVVGVNVGWLGLADIGCKVGSNVGPVFVTTPCATEGALVGVPVGTGAVAGLAIPVGLIVRGL